jgi:hypothetical protein
MPFEDARRFQVGELYERLQMADQKKTMTITGFPFLALKWASWLSL